MSEVRIDKYLWSIRVYKTRSEATDACKGGKVKVNGSDIKPSKAVRPGDMIVARKGPVTYTYRVIELIDKRQGPKLVPNYAENLTPEKLQEYQKAQGEIGSALGRLLAITEAYPDLKANENFRELQAQLEGTENRITVERRNFNEVAREYNTSIRTFPKTIIAGMCGFDKRPYFEAEEGANKAPEVKF